MLYHLIVTLFCVIPHLTLKPIPIVTNSSSGPTSPSSDYHHGFDTDSCRYIASGQGRREKVHLGCPQSYWEQQKTALSATRGTSKTQMAEGKG